MNKVIHVPAYFKAEGETRTVKKPTGETTTGFFGGDKPVMKKEQEWAQTGWSDCAVDSERLTKDLNKVVSELNKNDFEVVSVTPVLSGNYKFSYHAQAGGAGNKGYGGYGYGYGYSYTDSLIVIAKKRTGDTSD